MRSHRRAGRCAPSHLLQEICRAVGIPPVPHVGSCVDNSRILEIVTNVVAEGGLGDDISGLPVAGAAPEWGWAAVTVLKGAAPTMISFGG
jgi:hydroxylamine reductase (hybrid-cluster protein)